MISPKISQGETAWDRQMRKVWTTRGARLEASRRLARAGRASTWVVTVASLALVALSLSLGLPLFGLGDSAKQLAQLISAVGAISILVVSAIESGKSYEVRAERHHRAAKALTALYDGAAAAANGSLDDLVSRYHDILDRFEENHEPLDYYMFAARHPDDFTVNFWQSLKMRVLWHLSAQFAWVIVVAIGLGFAVIGWAFAG